jgi:DNA-binding MarR family transcriptional regulator
MSRKRAGVDAERAEILNAFRRILQALRLAAVQTHVETGMSAAQLFVLSQLDQNGSMSIKDLAQATMTDRSSVADVVDRLAARRLLKRTLDPDDRRRAIVRLTPKGQALLRGAPAAPTSLLLDGLHGLNHAEIQALATGLSRLCDELGLADAAPQMLFERVRGADEPTRRRARAK